MKRTGFKLLLLFVAWVLSSPEYSQNSPISLENLPPEVLAYPEIVQFNGKVLVVDEDYMTTLGIDPSDPDLEVIGRDWVGPSDAAARARLYGRVIDAAMGS